MALIVVDSTWQMTMIPFPPLGENKSSQQINPLTYLIQINNHLLIDIHIIFTVTS
jgi:hypothetical protein